MKDDKVFSIVDGGKEDAPVEPDEHVIAVLEAALARAKAEGTYGLVLVSIGPQHMSFQGAIMGLLEREKFAGMAKMLGGIDTMRAMIEKQVLEGMEDAD